MLNKKLCYVSLEEVAMVTGGCHCKCGGPINEKKLTHIAIWYAVHIVHGCCETDFGERTMSDCVLLCNNYGGWFKSCD
jgi:hypothetical protein